VNYFQTAEDCKARNYFWLTLSYTFLYMAV